MAKINLPPKKVTPTQLPPIPPPASLPPGISSGTLPLPVGRAVTAIDPARLTPDERKQLNLIGWKEGQPIPSNMAEIIDQVSKEMIADHEAGHNQLPVDPSTPPVKFSVTDIASLPLDQQEALKTRIAAAMQAQASPLPSRGPAAPLPQNIKTVETATVAAPVRPAPAGNVVPNPNYVAPPVAATAPTEEPAHVVESNVAPLTHCPNCKWDLKMTSDIEPSEMDRYAFLQSVLGLKPFSKEYRLFDGRLLFVFRTLSTSEIDVIYRQAYRERDRGEITTMNDFLERVMRLRCYLQLLRVYGDGLDHEMPDGLSTKTNAFAVETWNIADTELEPMKEIESYLLANIIRTETIQRLLHHQCMIFNRLVARLEALSDRPDFLKATGSLP